MPSSSRLPYLLVLTSITIGLFLTRAPFMMTATAPSPSKLWADGPIKLVTTPQYETKKTDMFTTGATHMALLHNSILRGYNSIYNQIPYIRNVDRADFIGYCLTWHKFVKTHHDDEEAVLFTKLGELLKDETAFDETHKEHEAFLGGLSEFHSYLSSLANPADFSRAELLRIMSGFQVAFERHFHSEIRTIAALAGHSGAPKPGSHEEATAAAALKSWGKNTVTKAGITDVVPFFLLNLDRTAEEGTWASWPPMPAPVRWGLVNIIAGAFHSGWWRFASCDAAGKPKELWALQFPAMEAS